MRKIIGYTVFWLFVASLFVGIVSLFYNPVVSAFLITPVYFLGREVFKGTLNLVQGIGFVYWVTRDTHKGFSLSIGFMRETDYPWRTGKGLQIGIGKYAFQLGFCRRNKPANEIMGLTHALKGRELNLKPKEISTWK